MKAGDIMLADYTTSPERRGRYSKGRFFKSAFWFYLRYSLVVIDAGIKFLLTRDPQKAVTRQSLTVMSLSESLGVHMHFEGLDRYPAENGPYVFACNHMGTFEVNALPGLVASRTPMTFVVKTALIKTPFFGRVLKGLRAIPVRRRHPGEDLRQVLEEGTRRLAEGVSVILFPEGTRQDVFSFRTFNSLAVKLASRAGVPVVPVALRTDFWGVGKIIKNYGRLRPELPCRISFGAPIHLSGRGKAEHRQVFEFIADHLESWGLPVDRGPSVSGASGDSETSE